MGNVYGTIRNEGRNYGHNQAEITRMRRDALWHYQLVKLNLYQQAGREYWIVDPENRTVRVMIQADDNTLRTHEIYKQEDITKVSVLDGCFIELSKVFSE